MSAIVFTLRSTSVTHASLTGALPGAGGTAGHGRSARSAGWAWLPSTGGRCGRLSPAAGPMQALSAAWLAFDACLQENVQAFVEQNKPWRCAVCLNFQEIICFPKETKNPKKTWTRVCNSCVAVRRCGRCGLDRNADMCSERMWRQGKKTGHCKLCLRQRGVKPCPVVRVSFERARAALLLPRSENTPSRKYGKRSIIRRQWVRSRAKAAVSRLARRVPCPSCGYEVTTRANV